MRDVVRRRIGNIRTATKKLYQDGISGERFAKRVKRALALLRPIHGLTPKEQDSLTHHKLGIKVVLATKKERILEHCGFDRLTAPEDARSVSSIKMLETKRKKRVKALTEVNFTDVCKAPFTAPAVITNAPHHDFRHRHTAERPKRFEDLAELIEIMEEAELIDHRIFTNERPDPTPLELGTVTPEQETYLQMMANLSLILGVSVPLDDTGDTPYDPKTEAARYGNHRAVNEAFQNIFAKLPSESPRTAQFLAVAPPAHHACAERAHGYCIDNHTFELFKRIMDERLSRKENPYVLFVDCDFHDGDGTRRMLRRYILNKLAEGQDAILDRIRFVNFYAHGEFPHTKDDPKPAHETEFPQVFRNVAYVPSATNDADFIVLINAQMITLRRERFFSTDTIVSLGCDAHKDDYPGGQLTEYAYEHLAKILVDFSKAHFISNGSISVVFEGGYNSKANARCVAGFLRHMAAFYHPKLRFDLASSPEAIAARSRTPSPASSSSSGPSPSPMPEGSLRRRSPRKPTQKRKREEEPNEASAGGDGESDGIVVVQQPQPKRNRTTGVDPTETQTRTIVEAAAAAASSSSAAPNGHGSHHPYGLLPEPHHYVYLPIGHHAYFNLQEELHLNPNIRIYTSRYLPRQLECFVVLLRNAETGQCFMANFPLLTYPAEQVVLDFNYLTILNALLYLGRDGKKVDVFTFTAANQSQHSQQLSQWFLNHAVANKIVLGEYRQTVDDAGCCAIDGIGRVYSLSGSPVAPHHPAADPGALFFACKASPEIEEHALYLKKCSVLFRYQINREALLTFDALAGSYFAGTAPPTSAPRAPWSLQN